MPVNITGMTEIITEMPKAGTVNAGTDLSGSLPDTGTRSMFVIVTTTGTTVTIQDATDTVTIISGMTMVTTADTVTTGTMIIGVTTTGITGTGTTI